MSDARIGEAPPAGHAGWAGQVVLGYEIPRAELKMLLKTGRLKVIPFSR